MQGGTQRHSPTSALGNEAKRPLGLSRFTYPVTKDSICRPRITLQLHEEAQALSLRAKLHVPCSPAPRVGRGMRERMPLLILAATTGARRGQLLALKWADADFEHASLSFQRAWVEGPNGPVLAPTKTRRSHRVALDPYTQHLLEEQWGLISAGAIGDLDGAFVLPPPGR